MLLRLFALLALLAGFSPAHAAISCTNVTSAGASINYQNNTTPTLQATFTVTCTRTSTSDATSVNYEVEADNGLYSNGTNNRARHAVTTTSLLKYDLYTASNCGSKFKGNSGINDTITWAANETGPKSKQTSYWVCIKEAQTAGAEGLYSDTVTLVVKWGASQVTGSPLVPISIYAPAYCNLSNVPNISVSYTAFGAQQAGTAAFTATCTISMPYTVTTDVDEGVVSGLRYILTVATPAPNGTGAVQNNSVTATFPAGQAGACATSTCNGTNTHTLIVTY